VGVVGTPEIETGIPEKGIFIPEVYYE